MKSILFFTSLTTVFFAMNAFGGETKRVELGSFRFDYQVPAKVRTLPAAKNACEKLDPKKKFRLPTDRELAKALVLLNKEMTSVVSGAGTSIYLAWADGGAMPKLKSSDPQDVLISVQTGAAPSMELATLSGLVDATDLSKFNAAQASRITPAQLMVMSSMNQTLREGVNVLCFR